MLHVAVDPEQHPVDQYRYDSEWSDILQYMALLYLHSKVDYYKEVGRASEYNAKLTLYRDLDAYSLDFMKFLEEVLDAKEYAYVKGQLENAHAAIKARNFKPLWLRQAFRNIRDDLPHVHSPRIKAVLKPLVEYFRDNCAPNIAIEQEALSGMKRVRNPRLQKVMQTVEADLPNMAAAVPELKATSDEIAAMSRVEKISIAQKTEDEDTLVRLLDSGDRSVIAVLFARGYLKGNAARIYLSSKLITPGNFKKLRDDVCFKYLTDMPWDWTYEKVRGRSVWKDWYNSILAGNPDLLLRMVNAAIDRVGKMHETEMLFELAANRLPPAKMTPAIVARVWKFADDPLPLVKRIPKDVRIEEYKNRSYDLRESLWLYDCTKDELTPFLKARKLTEEDFISQHFGSSWGPLLVEYGRHSNIVVWKDFWSQLSASDVALLKEVENFTDGISSGLQHSYTFRRYPGGSMKFFSDVYTAASRDGKVFLLSFLPKSYLDYVRDQDTTNAAAIDDKLNAIAAAHAEEDKKKVAEWKSLYGADLKSAPPRYWLEILRAVDPGEVLDIYQGWATYTGWYSDWDDLEELVASRCAIDDLPNFLGMTWKSTGSTYLKRIYKAALPRLDASMAVQLVRVDDTDVRKWVAANYPMSHIGTLLRGNDTYFEYICEIADRAEGDSATDLLGIVSNEWPTQFADVSKDKALACLVKQVDNSDSYMDSSNPVVQRAAIVKASKARAEKALTESEFPLLEQASQRADFGTDATSFVAAYLKNPKLAESWVHGDYKKALKYLDAAALRMSPEGFTLAVAEVNDLLSNGPSALSDSKPWGLGAYCKYVDINAPTDIAAALETRMNVRTTLPEHASEIPTNVLLNAARKGPWESVNNDVWYVLVRFRSTSGGGDSDTPASWVGQCSIAELENLVKLAYEIGGWGMRYRIQQALDHAKEIERFEKKGDLISSMNAALESDDWDGCCKLLEDAFTSSDDDQIRIAGDITKQIYMSKDEAPKIEIISHASDKLLNFISGNNVVARSMVLLYGGDDYFNNNFQDLKKTYLDEELAQALARNKPRDKVAIRHTRLKAAMVRRATADQALELFKFFYSEQREFGPKVREAFLEKLDDVEDDNGNPVPSPFLKKLKKFLLSKKFHLRYRKFTMEMLPIVLKIDDPDITAKFNGSTVFREKAIGNLGDAWKALPTKKEKEDFLDDIKDRGMMERLLRVLVEENLPLRSPLNEEFALGSNNTPRCAQFIGRFQQSTTTTTHAELFRLSCEHATTAEIREWLLENPMRVFDYNKATTDVSKTNLRIDWIDDRTNNAVSKRFTDTWDHQVHGHFTGSVQRVYGVVTPRTPKRTSRNIRELYHGTDWFAAGCIIQGGFKIMSSAKAGRLLGNGIYFSDIGSKVCGYLYDKSFSHRSSRGVVLVCEVDLGNMLHYDKMRYPVTSHNWMRNGYDSIYMERGTPYGGGRKILNNEYCVADVSRIKILYAMDVETQSRYR